jgi:DNA-binding NtrC family response regulator
LITPVILIIDDVSDIVEEMVEMLALMDLPAIGAGSIAKALPLLDEHRAIRLLICDLRLPCENGADLRERIAGFGGLEDRCFKIIFMSGDSERVEAMVAGPGQIVMTKPIHPSRLIQTILDCLHVDGDTGAVSR